MDEQKEIDRYADYLNAIARTGLLFNRSSELADFTGYKPAQTSFGKYGGNHLFPKRAAFDTLDATRVKTIDPDYSLSVLLEDYKVASDYYARFKRHRYFSDNGDRYLALVEHFYGGRGEVPDKQLAIDIRVMEKDEVDETRSVVPLLIMMSLGVIPSYWNKRMSEADIETECQRMAGFVEEMVSRSEIFSYQPVLSRFKKFAEGGTGKNRISLIWWFEMILLCLFRTSSPSRLAEGFQNLRFADFDIEGVWQTKDAGEVWRFERISGQAFYAYQYRVTSSEVWLYNRYELMFMDEMDKIVACLMSSDAIDDIVKMGGILPMHQSFVRFTCDEQKQPQWMTMTDIGADELAVACTLVRLGKEDARLMLDEHLSRAIFLHPEKDYQVYSTAAAMTGDYLFFPVPGKEGLYYRVPRIDAFQGLLLESFLVITMKDRVIVGTGVNLIYYEVTTEAQRKKHGIDITEAILV